MRLHTPMSPVLKIFAHIFLGVIIDSAIFINEQANFTIAERAENNV